MCRHRPFRVVSKLTLGIDLEGLPDVHPASCIVLPVWPCGIFSKDPLIVLLSLWVAVQVTWVTMLVVVQLVQIGRGITTNEAMRGHLGREPAATEVVPVSGMVAAAAAEQVDAEVSEQRPRNPQRPQETTFCTQWKKLFGIDAFLVTARSGLNRSSDQRRDKPFSRGTLRNCADFWCDPAPLLGRRENATAMLDGVIIDYSTLFEPPMTATYSNSDLESV